MFLDSVEGDIIFNRLVRFQIARELEKIPILVQFTFRSLFLQFFLFKFIRFERMGSRLHQTGVNSYAFVDGKALSGEL